ncbi:hypothetical protein BESB_015030 [Besnoitia besnoiti]|uniref:cysteine dioxygenase n=1 Tax=Besnoitia besnoiti TaxID=94643 RepID=A0A2A9MBW8_BESBE|nr:hypothetical protein BESB_015030 [Besnoitia besnoiti]PFH32890.1 hypothetical protein BESB_015030 [Besnoitia besnoiti]
MRSITEFGIKGEVYHPLRVDSGASSLDPVDPPRDREKAGIGTLEELHHHIFRLLANTADPHRLARTKLLLQRYNGQDWRLWKQRLSRDAKRAHAYSRSAVWKHPGCFQLLILTWAPGCCSPIHNHPCERCFLMPLHGTMAEARFWVDEESEQCTEICRSTMKTHTAYWIDDSYGWHAVMNLGSEDAVSLHLYIPEIVRCKMVHPVTHGIRWTSCASDTRDAPPAAHQRLLRILSRALAERSADSDGCRGESLEGSLARCLLSAFGWDEDCARRRHAGDSVEKEKLATRDDAEGWSLGGGRMHWSFADHRADAHQLRDLFCFERNAEPFVDERLLHAIQTVVELCTGRAGAVERPAQHAARQHAKGVFPDSRARYGFRRGSRRHTVSQSPALFSLVSSPSPSPTSEGDDEDAAGCVWDGWRQAPQLASVAGCLARLLLPRGETVSAGALHLGFASGGSVSTDGCRRESGLGSLSLALSAAPSPLAACETLALLDAAILSHVAGFFRENEQVAAAPGLLEGSAENWPTRVVLFDCASPVRGGSRCSTYYRMRRAAARHLPQEAEEGAGAQESLSNVRGPCAEDSRGEAFPRMSQEVQTVLLHATLRDLYYPPGDSVSPPSLYPAALDLPAAAERLQQRTPCGRSEEDATGERQAAAWEAASPRSAEEVRGVGGKPPPWESEDAHAKGAASPPGRGDTPRTPGEGRLSRRAPLCGVWMESEVRAILDVFRLARHSPGPARPLCIFACSGSPYLGALCEAAALAGYERDRIVEVAQTPDGGVMSVTCLQEKILNCRRREVVRRPPKASAGGGAEADGRIIREGEHDSGVRTDESCAAFMIFASAGRSGALGGFDDFLALRRLADQIDAWLHIDGVAGGSFVFPREQPFQALCAGIGLADSLTWNAHAFLRAADDPASPVALFCRQDALPLLSSTHLNSASPPAWLSARKSLARFARPALGSVPLLQLPWRADCIGRSFPLWCLWRKLGDIGAANRVRQVYLRCRQLMLLLSHFPKRVKPPAFPTSLSKHAIEANAPGGPWEAPARCAKEGEKSQEAEKQTPGIRAQATQRTNGDDVDEQKTNAKGDPPRGRGKQTKATWSTAHGSGGTESLTGGQGEESAPEQGTPEQDSLDDQAGPFDIGGAVEDDEAFLRDREAAVDYLVDAAREVICSEPGAFLPPPALATGASFSGANSPGRLRTWTLEELRADSKRSRFSEPPGSEAAREAAEIKKGDRLSSERTNGPAPKEVHSDSPSACERSGCMHTPGAFRVAHPGRHLSFSVAFWWVPPPIRKEILTKEAPDIPASTWEELYFFASRIFRLLALLVERGRLGSAGQNGRRTDGGKQEKRGDETGMKDSKSLRGSDFRLSSDALSIHLVEDVRQKNRAWPEKGRHGEPARSGVPPTFLSVCIADPRVGEGDIAAILCLVNRLGMLLMENAASNS